MPPRTKGTLISCPCLKAQRCLSGSSPRFFASQVDTITSHPSLSTNDQIPPESPKFISIPKTVQEQAIYHPNIKGFLPVPRQIFPRKSQKDKTSSEYFRAVTPEPQPPEYKNPSQSIDPIAAYKAQQALHRRRNLRESLVELQARKKRLDHQVASRSAYKYSTNQRLLKAPLLDSERLTAPSVPSAMRLSSHKSLPDPDRAARIAEKRAQTAMKQTQREEERRNMLHTLYLNARSFITTAEELDAEVDRVFDDTEQFTNDSVKGENIWNLGYPETMKQLLSNMNRIEEAKVLGRPSNAIPITKQRLTRLAEELTGGKI